MITMIKITQNTTAMVKNGKVIYLIQNGKITQDPLKVRYFQRMIWTLRKIQNQALDNQKPISIIEKEREKENGKVHYS